MSRMHVDESRLLATALVVLGGVGAAGVAGRLLGIAVLTGVVLASVVTMTVGVLVLRLALGS